MLPQNRSILLVALGSNEGFGRASPTSALQTAVTKLCNIGAVIRVKSELYRTPAFPDGAGPDFANAVISLTAPWSAQEAITHLHEIEAQMGRQRKTRWGARHIDLDLLAIDDMICPDPETLRHWMTLEPARQQQIAPTELILPHPRLHERAFVLVPLADVAPDWVHPVLGRTARDLRDALSGADLDAVRVIPQGWQ